MKKTLKNWLIIGCIAWATILPLQNKAQTTTKTKDNLTESPEKRKVFLWYSIETEELNRLRNETIFEINKFRKANWLEELEFYEKAQEMAQQYADYCAKYNWKKWHRDMNWRWLRERWDAINNYYYWILGENLFFWSWTPSDVVQSRIRSVAHKENMLEKCFYKTWVWIAKLENGGYTYVLVLSD